MTRGVPALTIEQKEIIKANPSKFAGDIMKMEGMEGTTKRQIQDYQRRKGKTDEEFLADNMEEYIRDHGLPKEYGCIMMYLRYLKRRM